jgi:hypothetical protein
MAERDENAKALRIARELRNAHNWKHLARWHGAGYYELQTEDTGEVPVRLFLTPQLLNDAEDILYRYTLHSNSSALIINDLAAGSNPMSCRKYHQNLLLI